MNTAIARAEKLVEQFPENEMARFSFGKALFDAGQTAAARQQFEIALAKKPDWMMVQILIGKCALALEDVPAAKAAFERARQLALAQDHQGPLEEMNQLLAGLS